ncbi:hypothetical protein [Paracoccus ravus]|uniref:hypothetical protein n=1 Tax=Paracoccus ravus TaxID=2447760 RepID=UPI00106E9075|nr:hypothetical protein [Paracoccus ravus]
MTGIAILLGLGEARLADRSFAIAPGAGDGALRLLPDGPELRMLRFGERGRLARDALRAAAPEAELAQAALRLATVAPGRHPAAAALALHLAGAGAERIGFVLAQSLVARHLGWSPAAISEAVAAEIDLLAGEWHRSTQSAPGGWTRVVFEAAPAGGEESLDSLAESLARDLLTRAMMGTETEALSAISVAAARRNPEDPHPAANARGVPSGPRRRAGLTLPDRARADAPSDAPPQPLSDPRTDATPAAAHRAASRHSLCAAPQGRGAGSPDLPPAQGSADARLPSAQAQSPVGSEDPAAATARRGRDALPQMARAAFFDMTDRLPGKAAGGRGFAESSAAMPMPPAFANWFSAPPRPEVPAAAEVARPSPWVWNNPEPPPAHLAPMPAPTLALPPASDPLDALAEALHLAADLRGIAP